MRFSKLKIFGLVLGVFLFAIYPTFVQALTATEIQAQINQLLAQIAVLQRQITQTTGTLTSVITTATSTSDIGTVSTISSCGNITRSGSYKLDRDLRAEGNCLNISAPTNSVLDGVYLDCDGHSVENRYDRGVARSFYPSTEAVTVKNVSNFSIKNCRLSVTDSNPNPDTGVGVSMTPLAITNSSNGVMDHNTFMSRMVTVEDSKYLTFSNNTFSDSIYQQRRTNYSLIKDNNLTASRYLGASGVIALDFGSNNRVFNNTIDGASNGIYYSQNNYSMIGNGADDGITLSDESSDSIIGNNIKNNWDCGIETIGLIKNTEIKNNYIKNSGFCGIGGWYYNSLLNNTIADNTIDDAPVSLLFFRDLGLRGAPYNDQLVYFKDNNFIRNKIINVRPNNITSNLIEARLPGAGRILNGETMPTEGQMVIGNNVFTENNFGTGVAPNFFPVSMIVDGGGNRCGQTPYSPYPLRCQASQAITTGTIKIQVKLNGVDVTAASLIVFDYKSPAGVSTPNVLSNAPQDYPNMPVGNHTVAYRSLNIPTAASYTFQNISPASTQYLSSGGITFTFNFTCATGYTFTPSSTGGNPSCVSSVQNTQTGATGIITTTTVITTSAATATCAAVAQPTIACSSISDATRATYGIPAGATSGNASYTKNSCTNALVYTGGCSVPVAQTCTVTQSTIPASCSQLVGQYGIPAGYIYNTDTVNNNISYKTNSCPNIVDTYTYISGCTNVAPVIQAATSYTHYTVNTWSACLGYNPVTGVGGTQTRSVTPYTNTTAPNESAPASSQSCSVTVATGTVLIRATLNGNAATASGQAVIDYLAPAGNAVDYALTVPSDFPNVPVGTYTVKYKSATLPAGVSFKGINGTWLNTVDQTLATGGTITFTLDFIGPTSMKDSSRAIANVFEAVRAALERMLDTLKR